MFPMRGKYNDILTPGTEPKYISGFINLILFFFKKNFSWRYMINNAF